MQPAATSNPTTTDPAIADGAMLTTPGIAPRAADQAVSVRALEWTGCVLGLLGAFLLATNTSVSRWGWVAFLLANFAVIAFARRIRANGLLVQQLGFFATSSLGLYRAFWPLG
jgi:hypothetical protein